MKKQHIKNQVIFVLTTYPLGVGFASLFHKVQNDIDMVEFIAVLDEMMDSGVIHLDALDYRITSTENVEFFKVKRQYENLGKWSDAGHRKFKDLVPQEAWFMIEKAILKAAEKVNQHS